MSGGALDYAFSKINMIANDLERCCVAPEHRALVKHLHKLGDVLYTVEWVISGDKSPGEDIEQIRKLLSDRELTQHHISDLQDKIEESKNWIKTLEDLSKSQQ